MILVSPEKAPPPRPTATNAFAAAAAAPKPLSAASTRHKRSMSTPPPIDESLIKMHSSSSGKMRCSVTSPPPPPKRCKYDIVPQVLDNTFCCSSMPEPQETPVSAKSVLIDLNSGHSILNNPKYTDAPPPRLTELNRNVSGSSSSIVSATSSVNSSSSRTAGPILSFFDASGDSDGDDAELASYFPRIRLQMRPSRQRPFVPVHSTFVPIQNELVDASSGEQE